MIPSGAAQTCLALGGDGSARRPVPPLPAGEGSHGPKRAGSTDSALPVCRHPRRGAAAVASPNAGIVSSGGWRRQHPLNMILCLVTHAACSRGRRGGGAATAVRGRGQGIVSCGSRRTARLQASRQQPAVAERRTRGAVFDCQRGSNPGVSPFKTSMGDKCHQVVMWCSQKTNSVSQSSATRRQFDVALRGSSSLDLRRIGRR